MSYKTFESMFPCMHVLSFLLHSNEPASKLQSCIHMPIQEITTIYTVPALALGGVGSLPRASQFRGPHSSKKRVLG